MAIFLNPNNPLQPQKGVYEWFAVGNCYVSIYIGQAGDRKGSCYSEKGTLSRGISELQRSVFASNSPYYNKLDTDFIVGTAIKCFEQLGFECFWRHIDSDPKKEKEFVCLKSPILQDANGDIDKKYSLKQINNRYWADFLQRDCINAVKKAESAICLLIRQKLKDLSCL